MLIEIFNGVINRPYVFIFLATFAFIGITHLGLYRWLLFLVVGTLVAFVCEASSIRNGFPFGIYTYHPEAFEGELSILGVPYWDCLSFSFLTYFSYTIALVLYSPLYKTRGDLQVLDTKEIRRSPRVLITAALFMMMIDTVTDPVSHQGSKWFLGDLYHYPSPGAHFDVPMANYLGWYFVGITTLVIYTTLELVFLESADGSEKGTRWLPFHGILGSLVYLGVYGFMFGVSIYIEDYQLAIASTFIYVLPVAMMVALLLRPGSQATPAEIAAYLDDFPNSPVARRYFRDGPYSGPAAPRKTEVS